jgi:alkylated DNA repair dioxygenase AlkB
MKYNNITNWNDIGTHFVGNDFIFVKNAISDLIAKDWFNELLVRTNWHKDLKTTSGEIKRLNRSMAYIYDKQVIYKYANFELPGDVWNESLTKIKNIVEKHSNYKFNSVLLNLYEDGKEEIRWHSDKEDQLGSNPVILCLNLGAGRTFHLKNKADGTDVKIFMENGDVLIMKENCQENWLHAILKEKEIKEPRISLTFRLVQEELF